MQCHQSGGWRVRASTGTLRGSGQTGSISYLIPDVQVLRDWITSCGTCAIVWDLHDVVEAVKVYAVNNSHVGQRYRAD